MADGCYLNLGCGLVTPDGWENLDGSWNSILAKIPGLGKLLGKLRITSGAGWDTKVKYINLRKPWKKIPSSSAILVYASHVVEHLTEDNFHLFLNETKRVLRVDGTIRIVVPDLEANAKRYLTEVKDLEARNHFLWALNLHEPTERSLISQVYDLATGSPSRHKTMYDSVALISTLTSFGFKNISVTERGQSRVDRIAEVEYGDGYSESLYVEASI
jgi:hypothetical protein